VHAACQIVHFAAVSTRLTARAMAPRESDGGECLGVTTCLGHAIGGSSKGCRADERRHEVC
jgi:hypothetical protein